MTTLSDIDPLAKDFAEDTKALAVKLTELTDQLEALKRRATPSLRRLAEAARLSKARLAAAIEGAPHLFEKPRTQVMHGVKLGLTKGAGGIDWEDDAAVVARIHKVFGDEAAQYLHVKEKPNKDAIETLSVPELKKLGVEVVADGDRVVIKLAAGDIEKLVKALLKGAGEETDVAA